MSLLSRAFNAVWGAPLPPLPEVEQRVLSRAMARPEDAQARFMHLMRRELLAAGKKGGWRDAKPADLSADLQWCAFKLLDAVRKERGTAAIEHAVDIANLAMMLVDSMGALREAQE